MNESILPIINRHIRTVMLKRTGVLTDQLRSVSVDGDTLHYRSKAPMAKNIDLLVLGKEHYKEQRRRFPIQSRRELGKILSLEAQSNELITLYRIGDYIDGQREVQYWTITPAALAEYGLTPLLIVPESALLLSAKTTQLLSVERQGRTFWFARSKEGCLSAEKRGLIASAQMFLASAGLSEQIPQKTLGEDYLAVLFTDFVSITAKNLQGFNARLRKMESKDWQRHGLYSGGVCAVILSVYFGLSSLYLSARLDSALQLQSELSSQTKEVFDLQQESKRIEQKSLQLEQVMNLPQASNVPWRLIVPMFKNGVQITRFNMLPDGTYSLVCKAQKATSVLEFISKDPSVVAPKFNGQVNNYDGLDFFTVEFKIKQEG